MGFFKGSRRKVVCLELINVYSRSNRSMIDWRVGFSIVDLVKFLFFFLFFMGIEDD